MFFLYLLFKKCSYENIKLNTRDTLARKIGTVPHHLGAQKLIAIFTESRVVQTCVYSIKIKAQLQVLV